MKLELSPYLVRVKSCLKQLLEVLLKEYSYVSILATDSKGKRYRVSRSGSSIQVSPMTNERGFVVKVYDGKGYCEYSFNEINEVAIPQIVQKIKGSLVPLTDALKAVVKGSEYGILEEEACSFFKQSEFEIHPKAYGEEKIIETLQKMSDEIRSVDDRMIDAMVFYEFVHISKIFLSSKKDLEQSIMWSDGAQMGVACEGDEVKQYYKSYSNQGGAELLKEMQEGADTVAKDALSLLGTESIKPGEYEVICDPDVTGLIAHEAFGHGVEMDMFVKDRALAKSHMDKQVASPLITMHDGAVPMKDTGSFFFDDEGVLAQDTVIIDKGILRKGLSDTQTAMHLGTVPTGNARRESYERKAYTRMTNTYFEPGESTMEEMIASIEDGFLLQGFESGMEDPKNWGIQCMVTSAKEIKNGKLTGKIYSPIVMTGYVPDLLKSITMVSKDLVLSGSGYCGKGYKEFVKTSTGGPAIKARVRLG